MNSMLLFILACLFCAHRCASHAKVRRTALALAAGACVALGALSCQGVAIALARHLLPQVEPVTPATLKAQGIQAIVVLGGGALRDVPEYQSHALPPEGITRLQYGLYLRQETQLPIAYSGGVGWSDAANQVSEAEVAAITLKRMGLPPLQWLEDQSRDTHQNAQFTRALLHAQGIDRVAIVTHAWHMPRSQREFEAAGFALVLPAPMGFIRAESSSPLLWMPSAGGLKNSEFVLREWLGLWVMRLRERDAH